MRRFNMALLLFVAVVLLQGTAYAGVYGPDWTSASFSSAISHPSLYMVDSDPPAPTNAFNWINADIFSGGASTQIDSAQPNVANQIWTSPTKILFGFDFPYFGTNYNGVYVSLHGWISFDNPGNPRSAITARPDNVPVAQAPFNDFIAVYWDKMYQSLSQGQVFQMKVTDPMKGLIIQWHDVMLDKNQPNLGLFFQAIFWENGDINFNYTSANPPSIYGSGSGATIGIRAGSQYVEYGYNTATITFADYGVFFTYNEPNLPPVLAMGPFNPVALEEFPTSTNPKMVLQFYLEPKNVEGTVDGVGVIVQGPKATAVPAQYFRVFIVRDVNGNGFRDPEDPVVSGIDGAGDPLLWDPWFDGTYATYVAILDSPLTGDKDNEMIKTEGVNGRKYYLVYSTWGNLQSGDEYNFGIRDVLLSGVHYSALSPSLVNIIGTKLTVATLTAPDVQGPYFYPPALSQDIDVRAENVVALSFSVTASPDFDISMAALGLIKSGSGQGIYVAARVFADYGERGKFEAGTDIDVTADGWLSSGISATGGALAEGNPSGTFYLFLTQPQDPTNPTGHHTYLAKDGGTKHYLIVLTFYQNIVNEGDTYRISLSEIIYTGGPGSPLSLPAPLAGSVLRLVAPDLPLEVILTPFTPDVRNLSAVPGGLDIGIGRFSFRPYNRAGVLHQFTLSASGSGHDVNDISRMRVVFDRNMNGIIDPSDTTYFEGKWPADNGNLTITMIPPDGPFNPWGGGTTDDFTNMIHFIVVYDLSATVPYGSTFSYSVSEIQYTFAEMAKTILPTNWESPVLTIETVAAATVSCIGSPYASVRERFLVPAGGSTRQLEMAVVKVSAGPTPIRVSSFTIQTGNGGFTGDGDESQCIDQVLMYPDLNLNNTFGDSTGETWSWIGSAAARPILSNDGTVTIFVLEPQFGEMSPFYLTAYQSVTWRIYFAFNSNVKAGQGFMATVTSMQYETAQGGSFVAQPPIGVNIEGGRKEAVGSVYNGGSMTITKGPGMRQGATLYVAPGNLTEVTQFRLFCGNVEAVRVNSIDFRFQGSGRFNTPGGPDSDVTYVGFTNDNGDCIVNYTYDTDFNGNVTYNATTSVATFTPAGTTMVMQPGTTYYVLMYFIMANSLTIGLNYSAYLGPNDLKLQGGSMNPGWVPRNAGDPVQRFGNTVYGMKAVIGSSYQTDGNGGTMPVTPGDTSADTGNPWSDANKDWTGGASGGCFIATAAFGSLAQSTVNGLCNFRDAALSASASGSQLTATYYATSPAVAGELADSSAARSLLRSLLGSVR